MTGFQAAVRGRRAGSRGPDISITHALASSATMVITIGSFFVAIEGEFDNLHAFLVLAATVVAYSVVQSWLVYRKEGHLFFLNPVIHTALIGNFLLLVVGQSVFFLPLEYGGFRGEVTTWMVLWMLLYASASVALWTGYWSGFAVFFSSKLRRSPLLHRVVRREFRVNNVTIWVLLGLGIVSQFTMIALGIFGYSRDPALAAQSVGIQQYLTMGGSLIPLTLLVLALQFFSGRSSGNNPIGLFIVVFVFSVFSGLLSGFKSQVVMPILIVGLAYYVVYQKTPKWILPIGLVLLFFAYTIIEPFRAARNNDQDFQSQSFFYIYETMFSTEDSSLDVKTSDSTGKILHFVNAHFPIPRWSEGLRYISENEGLPEGSPQFLRNILIAPLLAVAPRAVWPDKPEAIEGNWFYVEVLGRRGMTSASMSGVTSLYFAGGWVAVLTGFFFFGVLQRVLFRGFLVYGAGGILIYLGLFSGLRGFNLLHPFIIDLIRTIPILIVLQYFIFRPIKTSRSLSK